MERILITGGSGRVGSYLCRKALSPAREIHATYLSHGCELSGVSFHRLDLRQEAEVRILLDEIRPDVLIHTAAIPNEDAEERLLAVNVKGTEQLVRYCEKTEAYLAHISTDLVFDGKKGNYRETDAVNPLGLYPTSKVMAEELIMKSCIEASILRITINYGWTPTGSSFGEWILKESAAGRKVPLFIDQFRSPIYLHNLADAIVEIAEKRLKGIFHLGGADRITRFNFGLKMGEVFGFSREGLIARGMNEHTYTGSHCPDCSLNIEKAQSSLSTGLLGVEEGLKAFRNEESPYSPVFKPEEGK
jgi:dTDP-4-dehydrorhamnose reductase